MTGRRPGQLAAGLRGGLVAAGPTEAARAAGASTAAVVALLAERRAGGLALFLIKPAIAILVELLDQLLLGHHAAGAARARAARAEPVRSEGGRAIEIRWAIRRR